jgi:hypothetical protein
MIDLGCSDSRAYIIAEFLINKQKSKAIKYYNCTAKFDDKSGMVYAYIVNYDSSAKTKSPKTIYYKHDDMGHIHIRNEGETFAEHQMKHIKKIMSSCGKGRYVKSGGGGIVFGGGAYIGSSLRSEALSGEQGRNFFHTGNPDQVQFDEYTHNFDDGSFQNPMIKMVDGGLGVGYVKPIGRDTEWYGF